MQVYSLYKQCYCRLHSNVHVAQTLLLLKEYCSVKRKSKLQRTMAHQYVGYGEEQ